MSEDINKDLSKKPFYKKWWFWVIIAILVLILISNGSKDTNNDLSNEDGNTNVTQGLKATEGAKNTEGAKESTPVPKEAISTRDNSSAVLTVLNTGNFEAGIDIPVGRYIITGDSSGNLFINNNSGTSYINEILGDGDLGVISVTTDINNGDRIEITGIKNVTFTPADTVLHKDTLTTGNWVVGLDFSPGRYDVSSTAGNGNFFVYDKKGLPIVNEILGGGEFGVDKVTVKLEEGFTITVGGMNEIDLVER